MPNILDELHDLHGSEVFATLDFCQGYWQIPLRKDSQDCQSFITPDGMYTLLALSTNCNSTDKGQAAALRVILEWLASTHEAVLPKHDARSEVPAWYRTNGVDFGRHDTNVLSLMTAAVNKARLAVPKAGRPAVKRAVGNKINPVNAVSWDDDSTSESSSSSPCYIDFSFTTVAKRRPSCMPAWRRPQATPIAIFIQC
jgi:hypothetical protein